MLYAGVLLVATLAIGTDVLLSWLQRRLTPRGVRVATGEAVLVSAPESCLIATRTVPDRETPVTSSPSHVS